jgi:alkylation response protein AidB-like acyl-CoA dehydrogenase
MDFSFTEEQSALRDTLERYLEDNYSFDQRRLALKAKSGWRPEVWGALAHELGILGASFPEELGGLGGGAVENMIVMEEFGKALVVEPYLSTVVIGGGFMKHSGYAGAADVIAKIIAGEVTLAFAYAEPQARYSWRDLKATARKRGSGWVLDGYKTVVSGAPWASHLIVTARTSGGQRDAQGISLFLMEKSTKGAMTRDYPTMDGQRASEVTFKNVALSADALIGIEGQSLLLVEKVIDEAVAALCAEACGVLRKTYDSTVDYTKQRKQFGVPISSFQVLQHRMVDMFMQLEQAISMTYMATIKLTDSGEERAKAASAAKVQVAKACRFVGQNAIQLHGGMGMSDELAIGHYFKRATMIESAFGSVDHHLARYERLTLDVTT